MTALAQPAPAQTATGQTGTSDSAPGVAQEGKAVGGGAQSPLTQQAEPESAPAKRSPAHYLWAVLIARTYEVFPLVCPICGGQMRLIAFITEGAEVRQILEYIGVHAHAPRISPARGPPLWDDCDAPVGEAVGVQPDWDMAAQAATDYEVDQRTNW